MGVKLSKRSAPLAVCGAWHQVGHRRTWIGSVALVLMAAGIAFWKINGLSHVQGAKLAPPPPPPAFGPTIENHLPPPVPAPEGMVWIPGGEFSMGAAVPSDGNEVGMQAALDSRPIHRVDVDGFWMDKTDVTNEEFAHFVKATGYKTVAERKPRAEDFPGAPPEKLVPGAVVFSPPDHLVPLNDHFQWWAYVGGANWKHPEGAKSTSKAAKNIQSLTLRMKTPKRTQNGLASGFPPRRSGNLLRVVASRGSLTCGAMNFGRVESGWPTRSREIFRTKTPVKTVTWERLPSGRFPERLRLI